MMRRKLVGRLLFGRPTLFRPSDRGALLCRCRVCRVELPVALFDAAGPLVPGNDNADMVWASALACSRDLPLRLAGRQSKDLIAEARRATPALSWLRGRDARAPARSRWSSRFRRLCRCFGCGRPPWLAAPGVAREHTLGRLQFAELAGQLLALCIDARQRLAEPLLLFGDLVQCRHSVPSRQSIG